MVVKVRSSEWMRGRNKPDLFWNNADLITLNRPDLDSEVTEAWVFISSGLETPFLVGCCYWLRLSIVCKLFYSVVWRNQLSHKIRTICTVFLVGSATEASIEICSTVSDQSINQSINQSIKQSSNQSINQSINQSSNQSINQSSNQSINQSINQSYQSINQSINLVYFSLFCLVFFTFVAQ